MESVAHRAGNSVTALRAAMGLVDVVEVDVHLGRAGRLEVRHGKRLWPTRRLWERWYLLPRDTAVPSLADIVDAAGPERHLWLDLKGPWPRLAERALEAMGERRPVTLSSKAWWMLGRFVDDPGIRTFRSAGNRLELFAALWIPSRAKVDGHVVHRRLLNEAVVARLGRRGEVFTWAVHDAATVARLERLGIDGVILDDLTLVGAIAPRRQPRRDGQSAGEPEERQG